MRDRAESLLTELHHEVIDQEEDPRSDQSREEDRQADGGEDAPLAVAASLHLHQVGTLQAVLLLPAAGRAWLLLYIAGNRNNKPTCNTLNAQLLRADVFCHYFSLSDGDCNERLALL